jgi:hypothetical protein
MTTPSWLTRILGDGRRQWTRTFSELQSHYLFADRFGRPGKGNDKGKVEGPVSRGAFLPLQPAPYEACEKQAARVSSLSLVHYRGNDYSVRLHMATARFWPVVMSTRW